VFVGEYRVEMNWWLGGGLSNLGSEPVKPNGNRAECEKASRRRRKYHMQQKFCPENSLSSSCVFASANLSSPSRRHWRCDMQQNFLVENSLVSSLSLL
jgi:hypothetical protein